MVDERERPRRGAEASFASAPAPPGPRLRGAGASAGGSASFAARRRRRGALGRRSRRLAAAEPAAHEARFRPLSSSSFKPQNFLAALCAGGRCWHTTSSHDPEETRARLLYRDGMMLVLDKPAGIAVHAGPKGGQASRMISTPCASACRANPRLRKARPRHRGMSRARTAP